MNEVTGACLVRNATRGSAGARLRAMFPAAKRYVGNLPYPVKQAFTKPQRMMPLFGISRAFGAGPNSNR